MPTLANAKNISEYRIKAAFIYNFAKFTQWPDQDDELRICIYGDDPFGQSIDALTGKQNNRRTVKIIRTKLIEEIRSCHIAYLNIIPPERRLYLQALDKIDGTNVLTISDAKDVIEFGVMIGLMIHDEKIAFEINHTAAKASDINISAKLLRLAKRIN